MWCEKRTVYGRSRDFFFHMSEFVILYNIIVRQLSEDSVIGVDLWYCDIDVNNL